MSSVSSAVSSTANGVRDIRIGQFTDIQFVSDMSCSQTAGTHTVESKQHSSGRVAGDLEVEVEVSRVVREDIELGELRGGMRR